MSDTQTPTPDAQPMKQTASNSKKVKRVKHEKDPRYHYSLVQRDLTFKTSEYVSPIGQMEENGYEIVSEDVADTGNSRLVLMRCPVGDYIKRLKAADMAALEAVGGKTEGGDRSLDAVQVQGAISLKDLGASLPTENPRLVPVTPQED